MGNENAGKKIFFLFPSVIIQNEIMSELTQQDYEVYGVKNVKNFQRIVSSNYPDSLVFANIDEGMYESEWEDFIRGLIEPEGAAPVLVGILSSNSDAALKWKYTNQVKIQCGFIPVKTDTSKTLLALQKVLTVHQAKGNRKFITASVEHETGIMINIPHNGAYINGRIREISPKGLCCTFNPDPKFDQNTLFEDVQLRLGSILAKVEVIVFGIRREESGAVYVLLFTNRTDAEAKSRIRKFTQAFLQSRMDLELR
jgi:hypothetical protein